MAIIGEKNPKELFELALSIGLKYIILHNSAFSSKENRNILVAIHCPFR
jgi:hypothetical protein